MSVRIGAIDQGTTSTRLLVAGPEGYRIAASLAHETRYPQPGWVEQDAREILANLRTALAAAGPLDALGLANQGESCLAWDAASGEPLSPIIVWQDNRTAEELARFDAATIARVAARANLPVEAYFSASKLGWLLRHVPAVAAAHAAGRLRLGTTDAFYLDRLGGVFATDRATASRTALMHHATGDWDEELCAIFGVPRHCLPPIRPNRGAFGMVDGVPIRAAIVDQQAALYGHGCRAPGDTKITFGTGAFALALTAGAVPVGEAGGLLPTVAWDLGQGMVHALDGGVYDVGAAVDWAIRAGLAEGVADFARFEAAPAIERGLVFVPAFSGLAAPHWDRSAAPLLIGLTPETTRRDICQALLEGIALATAGLAQLLDGHGPASGPLSIDGGVSRSPYFAQFLADALGRPVLVRGFSERTAYGVALLVAEALGVALPAPAGEDRLFTPAGRDAAAWQARYARAVALSRGWREGA